MPRGRYNTVVFVVTIIFCVQVCRDIICDVNIVSVVIICVIGDVPVAFSDADVFVVA